MCIMEVRAGQRSSTIAQAFAHNTSTIDRDIDMFLGVLTAREETGKADMVRRAQSNLQKAYADFMEVFIEFVSDEETTMGRHFSEHEHHNGNERPSEDTLIAIAHHDAQAARRFQTR